MAVAVYGDSEFSNPQATTQVYSTRTGQLVRTFPDVYFVSWSPTGHQLVIMDTASLYFLNEPERLSEPLTPLANPPCTSMLWNPKP
jgi:hypothetical protein